MTVSLFRLVLNVHSSFPIPNTSTSSGPTPLRRATTSWSLTPMPARALALLSPEEVASVLRFLRPEDAALALGSCLLKRLAVVRGAGATWAEAGRGMKKEEGGKPIWRGEYSEQGEVEFNVSHHGNMVVLVADAGSKDRLSRARRVGIDVVKIDVPKDTLAVRREGTWERWVRIFADVMHEEDVRRIVDGEDAEGRGQQTSEERLRRFYTFWGLREAYVKMSGEALVAPWLKELEFRNVKAPSKGIENARGDTVRGVEVWLHGERVEDIGVELQALGEDYIVVTTVELATESEEFAAFENVDVERDDFSDYPPGALQKNHSWLPNIVKVDDFSMLENSPEGSSKLFIQRRLSPDIRAISRSLQYLIEGRLLAYYRTVTSIEAYGFGWYYEIDGVKFAVANLITEDSPATRLELQQYPTPSDNDLIRVPKNRLN
ncbi:hypothetical protein MMC18_001112 [Xylographa bjoerkii]|nr:hypothetical protein [Xylographa bjoerkii]